MAFVYTVEVFIGGSVFIFNYNPVLIIILLHLQTPPTTLGQTSHLQRMSHKCSVEGDYWK